MKLHILIITILLSACSSSLHHLPVGLYKMSGESIIPTPVVTSDDFSHISLDTLFTDYPVIGITLTPEATIRFAEATEVAIGQQMAFVYNDSVIMAPRINSRIEGGRVQIHTPDTPLLYEIYRHLSDQLK